MLLLELIGELPVDVALEEALDLGLVLEGEAPVEDGEVLDPVVVPADDVAVELDRVLHHLLDDLDVAAERLARSGTFQRR